MLNVRRTAAILGRIAWAKNVDPFLLPAGLKDGDQVAIIEVASNDEIVVRDCGGNLHTLLRLQVDAGYEYEISPGDWRSESDPEVLARLQLVLNELLTVPNVLEPGFAMSQTVELVSRILKRNEFAWSETR